MVMTFKYQPSFLLRFLSIVCVCMCVCSFHTYYSPGTLEEIFLQLKAHVFPHLFWFEKIIRMTDFLYIGLRKEEIIFTF